MGLIHGGSGCGKHILSLYYGHEVDLLLHKRGHVFAGLLPDYIIILSCKVCFVLIAWRGMWWKRGHRCF